MLHRRHFFAAAGLPLIASLADWPAWSQENKEQAPVLEPLNRFPRMVQEYFVKQVRAAEAKGNALRQAVKTQADAQAYVKGVREKIAAVFNLPKDKTPLNAKVTDIVERDAYRIEKVIFESRPQFLVTANLYVPKNRKFPLPGVVGSCGHSATIRSASRTTLSSMSKRSSGKRSDACWCMRRTFPSAWNVTTNGSRRRRLSSAATSPDIQKFA